MIWDIWDGLLQKEFSVSHTGGWNRLEEIQTIQIGYDSTGDTPNAQKTSSLQNISRPRSTSNTTGTIYLCADIGSIERNGKASQPAGGADHRLYIMTAEELADMEHLPAYYVLTENKKKAETVNHIISLFIEGERWLSRIREAVGADHDMQALMELAGHYWNISVLIINAAYELREHVDMPDNSLVWAENCDENGRMTEESIANLYLNTPQFDETFTTHGLQEYKAWDKSNGGLHVSYYYNFMDETDTYMGRILFSGLDHTVSPEIQAVWNYVAVQAEICFQTSVKDTMATRLRRELHHLFLQMLGGEAADQTAVNVALGQKGWHITDGYILYRLLSNGNMHSHHTLAYYCNMLERTYPELVAVEKNHSICCLCHIEDAGNAGSTGKTGNVENTGNKGKTGNAGDTRNAGNAEDMRGGFREQLPYFLREHLFIAGVSNVFYDFFSINLYAGEAECALDMGSRYDSHRWVHRFSEYTLSYCLEKMTEEYPADELVAPGLKLLETYDREHPGSDLSMTLREYINQQFNATHTADVLHIHRTTLLYRLRRIQELTRLVLDDRDTILHLQLSYALMERRG
jgi:hypothetical protein